MPDDEDAIIEEMEENALGPKRVQGDNGNSVEQHPLPDQIAWDRYRRSRRASLHGLGIKLVKIIPPGSD